MLNRNHLGRLCGLLILVLFATTAAWSDALIVVTSQAAQGPNDSVNWSQLGADGTTLGSGFNATSGKSVAVTGNLAGPNSLASVVCAASSCSWTGTGFTAGDTLVWTSDAGNGGNGPLTLSFSRSVSGAGALIQADGPGQFTATIQAFNGTTSLGSFTVASNPNGDALYLGILDQTGPNITSVTFSLTSCMGVCTDFAVDTLNLNVPSATFPLSVTLAGMGGGIVTSTPAGISCPATCSANFNSGTMVTLTATPASGSTFAGWSGACTGTGSCSLTINSNQSVTATFNGSGGTPVLSLSAGSLTFPGQLLNTTSASKTITLTNSGTAGLQILSITPSGDFADASNCPISPSTLVAGATCTITVTFTPSVSGSIPGEITINDNAAGSAHLVTLTGTGLTSISLSPTSLAFGMVTVGTTSAAKTVTLTNNLTTALTIGLSASGDYALVGNGTTPCGISLAGKAKCTMSVTFSPKFNGSINGAVTVTYNANLSPQNVALSGTGSGGPTSPLTFSPPSLSFSSQLVGTTSASKTVTVTNSSTSSVTLSTLSTSGNYTVAGSGTNPCPGNTLAAGATCAFTVAFSPSINAPIKGAVTITDNTSVSPQVYNLSGAAVLPLSFSPTSLTFAAQTVGTTSAPKTVTLTNNQNTSSFLTPMSKSCSREL